MIKSALVSFATCAYGSDCCKMLAFLKEFFTKFSFIRTILELRCRLFILTKSEVGSGWCRYQTGLGYKTRYKCIIHALLLPLIAFSKKLRKEKGTFQQYKAQQLSSFSIWRNRNIPELTVYSYNSIIRPGRSTAQTFDF